MNAPPGRGRAQAAANYAWRAMARASPPRLPTSTPSAVAGLGTVVVVVGLTTLLVYPLKSVAPVVSLGIVYLVGVLVVSSVWGAWFGLLAAVASAGAFNFFHLPPTGGFTIRDGENWVALTVFGVVAVGASYLAQAARARAAEAGERRREADLPAGLYGMLLFAILAVFISGLMVGRTPEFLGKKIEAREVKLVIFGAVGVPLLVLATTALAIATPYGRASIYDDGPQGFSETLYAYASQANNNGSAFAGYTGFVQPADAEPFGISFANVLGGLAMLGGRFLPLIAVLAVAGSLAAKRVAPPGAGTLRTDSPTFVWVLVSVVLIVALLTFVPALLLGPVVQGLTAQLF